MFSLPHPPLYLSEIRPRDMMVLLVLGFTWELVARSILLLVCKLKPTSLRQREADYEVLEAQVNAKRKLGQQAFVETSKLERQLLMQSKALDEARQARQKLQAKLEKNLLRYGNIGFSLLIFLLYYGVPVLALEPLEQEFGANGYASPPLKTMFFPVSYVGIGMRVARIGLPDGGVNQLGALVVFWSAQVVGSQLFNAIDAYVLYVVQA